jgi:hypothetical protein
LPRDPRIDDAAPILTACGLLTDNCSVSDDDPPCAECALVSDDESRREGARLWAEDLLIVLAPGGPATETTRAALDLFIGYLLSDDDRNAAQSRHFGLCWRLLQQHEAQAVSDMTVELWVVAATRLGLLAQGANLTSEGEHAYRAMGRHLAPRAPNTASCLLYSVALSCARTGDRRAAARVLDEADRILEAVGGPGRSCPAIERSSALDALGDRAGAIADTKLAVELARGERNPRLVAALEQLVAALSAV